MGKIPLSSHKIRVFSRADPVPGGVPMTTAQLIELARQQGFPNDDQFLDMAARAAKLGVPMEDLQALLDNPEALAKLAGDKAGTSSPTSGIGQFSNTDSVLFDQNAVRAIGFSAGTEPVLPITTQIQPPTMPPSGRSSLGELVQSVFGPDAFEGYGDQLRYVDNPISSSPRHKIDAGKDVRILAKGRLPEQDRSLTAILMGALRSGDASKSSMTRALQEAWSKLRPNQRNAVMNRIMAENPARSYDGDTPARAIFEMLEGFRRPGYDEVASAVDSDLAGYGNFEGAPTIQRSGTEGSGRGGVVRDESGGFVDSADGGQGYNVDQDAIDEAIDAFSYDEARRQMNDQLGFTDASGQPVSAFPRNSSNANLREIDAPGNPSPLRQEKNQVIFRDKEAPGGTVSESVDTRDLDENLFAKGAFRRLDANRVAWPDLPMATQGEITSKRIALEPARLKAVKIAHALKALEMNGILPAGLDPSRMDDSVVTAILGAYEAEWPGDLAKRFDGSSLSVPQLSESAATPIFGTKADGSPASARDRIPRSAIKDWDNAQLAQNWLDSSMPADDLKRLWQEFREGGVPTHLPDEDGRYSRIPWPVHMDGEGRWVRSSQDSKPYPESLTPERHAELVEEAEATGNSHPMIVEDTKYDTHEGTGDVIRGEDGQPVVIGTEWRLFDPKRDLDAETQKPTKIAYSLVHPSLDLNFKYRTNPDRGPHDPGKDVKPEYEYVEEGDGEAAPPPADDTPAEPAPEYSPFSETDDATGVEQEELPEISMASWLRNSNDTRLSDGLVLGGNLPGRRGNKSLLSSRIDIDKDEVRQFLRMTATSGEKLDSMIWSALQDPDNKDVYRSLWAMISKGQARKQNPLTGPNATSPVKGTLNPKDPNAGPDIDTRSYNLAALLSEYAKHQFSGIPSADINRRIETLQQGLINAFTEDAGGAIYPMKGERMPAERGPLPVDSRVDSATGRNRIPDGRNYDTDLQRSNPDPDLEGVNHREPMVSWMKEWEDFKRHPFQFAGQEQWDEIQSANAEARSKLPPPEPKQPGEPTGRGVPGWIPLRMNPGMTPAQAMKILETASGRPREEVSEAYGFLRAAVEDPDGGIPVAAGLRKKFASLPEDFMSQFGDGPKPAATAPTVSDADGSENLNNASAPVVDGTPPVSTVDADLAEEAKRLAKKFSESWPDLSGPDAPKTFNYTQGKNPKLGRQADITRPIEDWDLATLKSLRHNAPWRNTRGKSVGQAHGYDRGSAQELAFQELLDRLIAEKQAQEAASAPSGPTISKPEDDGINPSELVAEDSAAAAFGISVPQLRKMVADGKLKVYGEPGNPLYHVKNPGAGAAPKDPGASVVDNTNHNPADDFGIAVEVDPAKKAAGQSAANQAWDSMADRVGEARDAAKKAAGQQAATGVWDAMASSQAAKRAAGQKAAADAWDAMGENVRKKAAGQKAATETWDAMGNQAKKIADDAAASKISEAEQARLGAEWDESMRPDWKTKAKVGAATAAGAAGLLGAREMMRAKPTIGVSTVPGDDGDPGMAGNPGDQVGSAGPARSGKLLEDMTPFERIMYLRNGGGRESQPVLPQTFQRLI